jgi:beta-lactamase regulating signal transducer with metallopeptidase domain
LSNAAWACGLAVLAALVGRWGQRPALTHSLWVLVLIKLITPPLWSLSLPQPPEVTPGDGVAARTTLPEITPEPDRQPDADLTGASTPTLEPALPPADESTPEDAAKPSPAPAIPWTAAVVTLWLTGSAAWFLLAGWRLARFRTLLRCAQPAPAAVRDQVLQLAQGLGLRRLPGVWFVPGAVSPMLWAVLGRPRLLVPAALWERLGDDQRAALLAHELAHLRRRDHWVRRLELVATGLYWWHPVVWWARRAIERAEEECCDAWVVWVLPQAVRAYAEALLETVDFLSEVRCPLPPAVSGIGHVHFLRRRLAMIMRGTCTRNLSRSAVWALVGLGALVLPLLPGLGTDPSAAAAMDDPARAVAGGERSEPPSRGREEARPGSERRPVDPAARGRGGVQPPSVPRPAEEVENARDEVELLEIQLQGKRAELKEVEARLQIAARQRDLTQKLYEKGTASEGVMAKARDDVDLANAQVQSKMVQVKEAEVRLNQAKRRLARLQGPSPEGRGAARVPTPARPGQQLGDTARLEQLRGVLEQYQQQYERRKAASPREAKEIESTLERLKAEISSLERERGARGQPEARPLPEVQKARQELERAIKELEQYRARAEEQMKAHREMAEAERARAEAEAAKARDALKKQISAAKEEAEAKDALKRRILAAEKEAAEKQRFLERGLQGQARPDQPTPQLKAIEDRLNALTKEMEALRKEIRDLAAGSGRAPGDKPKPKPSPSR